MNKKFMSFFALGIFGLLGISLVMAYQGPNYSEERHEVMVQVFEDLDYDSWKALMAENGRNPKVMEVVTEDNFQTFVKMREARISGNVERANELKAELGLGQGNKQGNGQGKRMNYEQRHS